MFNSNETITHKNGQKKMISTPVALLNPSSIVTNPDVQARMYRIKCMKKFTFPKGVIKWVAGLFLILISNLSHAVLLSQGYNANVSVSTDAEGETTAGTGLFQVYPTAFYYKLASTNGNKPTTSCDFSANEFPWGTYGSYSGYVIAPGILAVPSGTISSTLDNRTALGPGSQSQKTPFTRTISATGGDGGTSTNTGSLKNCRGSSNAIQTYGVSTNSKIKWVIFVSTTAAPVTLSGITVHYQTCSYNADSTCIRSSATFPSLEYRGGQCTVSHTGSVQFGDITPSAVGTAVPYDTQLGVACTLSSATKLNVTYSVTPKTLAGDKYTLPMLSKGNSAVGDVRGFIGSSALADAGCSDKTSSMRLDGTPVLLRSITKSESWSDPLVWVLCPRKGADAGSATAIASMDVNW